MKTVSLWLAGAMILPLLMVGTLFGQENETPWYKNVDIEIDAVGVLQGSPGMTRKDDSYRIDSATDATLVFDLKLTVPTSKSGKAFMQFKTANGSGIDRDIPNISLFNAATADNNFRLAKIWYEHVFGEKVRLRGGKIDLTTDFDNNAVANDEYDQFLSGGFVNNPVVEFPGYSNFGAMLWISPNEFFDIGVGFADGDPNWDGGDWDNVFKNPFSILELGMKPKIADRQGNYRIYGWHNDNGHERLLSSGIADDANYGFGLSADQEITKDVTLFARYGHQRGSVSQVEHAWSAGVGISGRFLRREQDTLGFAYGQAIVGKDFKSLDAETGIDSGSEHRMEIYYKIKANKYLSFSPNLQWAKNPNGDRGNNNIWAFGVRTYLNLSN
ncbi:MAG: carbohydrate porin [Acidobacteriota bacterium]|jgi:carbohydrate-selective porin OprB|nr:carbohydrate porin [Acidobacteriota bacterium]